MKGARGVAAVVVLLLWTTCVLAQERAEGERPRGREADRGRQPLTPEQLAERQKQMKAGLARQAESLASIASSFAARRDELKAMAEKETLPVSPPPPQLFASRDARGGSSLAMRAAMLRRGGEPRRGGPEGGAERPGTFDVANGDELKKAIAKAADAYDAALPVLDEQKKAVEAELKQAEAGDQQDPAAARERMGASRDLMAKATKAQTAAGDAEAELQLLLAKAWLGVAKDKVTGDEAKAGAAKALEALDKYLALKAQLDELEQKIDQEAASVQEGLGQVLSALAPQGRGGRDGQGAGGGAADMIRRLDKNGDGKLSREEFPQDRIDTFDRLDRNRDGVIDASELPGGGREQPRPERGGGL